MFDILDGELSWNAINNDLFFKLSWLVFRQKCQIQCFIRKICLDFRLSSLIVLDWNDEFTSPALIPLAYVRYEWNEDNFGFININHTIKINQFISWWNPSSVRKACLRIFVLKRIPVYRAIWLTNQISCKITLILMDQSMSR